MNEIHNEGEINVKKSIYLLLASIMALSLFGCSAGVSQEDYDAVVAERDNLQNQLLEAQKSVDDVPTASVPSIEPSEEPSPNPSPESSPILSPVNDSLDGIVLAEFGYSRDDILYINSEDPSEVTEEIVLYNEKDLNYINGAIAYSFNDSDLLHQVAFLSIEKHTDNPNYFYLDHIILKNYVTDLYGEPLEDVYYWKEGHPESLRTNPALYLPLGDVALSTKWETETMSIDLSSVIPTNEYRPRTMLTITSKLY